MKNTLLKNHQSGILKKINFPFKENIENKKKLETDNIPIANSKNISIFLKAENRKAQLKNEILQEIKKKPALVTNMPLQRLEELNEIYNEKIQQNDILIQELQSKLNSLKQQ